MSKRRPPNTKVASAWTESMLASRWTVSSVRCALDEFESGGFYTTAALAEATMRDCIVFGELQKRIRALSCKGSLPFTVEESDEGDGRSRAVVAKRIRELWWTTCPEQVLAPLLCDTVMLATTVGVLHWDTSNPSEWIPYLRHLPAHGLEYAEYEGVWYYHTRDGERLKITPGDGLWFLHTPFGERSYMHGAIRCIAEPWLENRYARRDRARWCERHGMPVLAVKEPFISTDDIEGDAGSNGVSVSDFYANMRRGLTSGGIIRLPQGRTKEENGWEAEWIANDGSGFEAFSQTLKDNAREIEIALSGRASDDSGSKGGDGELANETVRNENLTSDAEPLCTSFREQIWKPYALYNKGDARLAGYGKYDTRTLANLKARASVLENVGTAIQSLEAAATDVKSVRTEFGLEVGPRVQAKPAAPEKKGNEQNKASTNQP